MLDRICGDHIAEGAKGDPIFALIVSLSSPGPDDLANAVGFTPERITNTQKKTGTPSARRRALGVPGSMQSFARGQAASR